MGHQLSDQPSTHPRGTHQSLCGRSWSRWPDGRQGPRGSDAANRRSPLQLCRPGAVQNPDSSWDQGTRELAQRPIRSTRSRRGSASTSASRTAPWQRWHQREHQRAGFASNFPKSTDLNNHSADRVAEVAQELNNRPRKTLAMRTPHEIFNRHVHTAASYRCNHHLNPPTAYRTPPCPPTWHGRYRVAGGLSKGVVLYADIEQSSM